MFRMKVVPSSSNSQHSDYGCLAPDNEGHRVIPRLSLPCLALFTYSALNQMIKSSWDRKLPYSR